MKRIAVLLPDDLARQAACEAERRGTTLSDLARTSLTQMLHPDGGREIPWAGVVCDPDVVFGASIDLALEAEDFNS